MGKSLTEIAILLISVATVALILNKSAKTVEVIQTGGGVFNSILKTVTLQGDN